MQVEHEKLQTPITHRLYPRFTYHRTPSGLMPMPTLPERLVLPEAGIDEVFDVRLATDDTTENDAFRVRWEVYCRELGYEPADRFPDGCERDGADMRSVQVVAYHRATAQPVGCYRLLMADANAPLAPFHVEEVCPRLSAGAIPRDAEARLGCAELSRFCIIAPFRRFDAASEAPPWGLAAERWASETRHRRGLAGLMWLTAAYVAVALRLDYLLTLMEPRLQLLGKAMGFDFQAIGDPVDFRGLRKPYRIDRRALRTLLAVAQTRMLLQPILPGIEAGIGRHPMLASYLASRTVRISR